VFQMLVDSVTEEIEATPPESLGEEVRNMSLYERRTEFLSIDPSSRGATQRAFQLLALSETAVISRFIQKLIKENIPEKLRPKLESKNVLHQRLKQALAISGSLCMVCKDPIRSRDEDTKTCSECTYNKLDYSHGLSVGTTKDIWNGQKDAEGQVRCFYTGLEITLGTAHLDHIFPKSKYPFLTTERTNLKFVHGSVNRMKGDLDPEEFLKLLSKLVDTLTQSDNAIRSKYFKDAEDHIILVKQLHVLRGAQAA